MSEDGKRHLRQRILDRQIPLVGLRRMEIWLASHPEAPDGYWIKNFEDFYLVGIGARPATVLTGDMLPYGVEIE